MIVNVKDTNLKDSSIIRITPLRFFFSNFYPYIEIIFEYLYVDIDKAQNDYLRFERILL